MEVRRARHGGSGRGVAHDRTARRGSARRGSVRPRGSAPPVLVGERREGWRAFLRVEPAGSRLVSLSAAPLQHDPSGVCDPEVRYIVVLRPAVEDTEVAGPTGFGGVIARSPAMGDV